MKVSPPGEIKKGGWVSALLQPRTAVLLLLRILRHFLAAFDLRILLAFLGCRLLAFFLARHMLGGKRADSRGRE